MTPIKYPFDMFGHTFTVSVVLDDSLMADAIADPSLSIFEDDVIIAGVHVGEMPQPHRYSNDAEGIRDMLGTHILESMEREGLTAITEHLSVERAANRADKARDDDQESRGG